MGADVSVEMLRHAKAAFAAAAVTNVAFVHLNGATSPASPRRLVDVVYCTGVFMHLDEWDRYRYVAEASACSEAGRTRLLRQRRR